MTDPLREIQRRFAEFAEAFPGLWLYSRLSRALSQDAAASLLLAAPKGQRRPVLLFAALHYLLTLSPDVPAARWYASIVGRDHLPRGDPWPDVRAALVEHEAELRNLVATRTTQTNEVNRSTYLAWALAQLPRRPTALIEIGSSAGLLLGLDRYRVELEASEGAVVLGDPTSPVGCVGRLDRTAGSGLDGLVLPPIVARLGIDLDPITLDDTDGLAWLRACLWPDVPGRVERFDSAVALLRASGPPPLVRADASTDLTRVLSALFRTPERGPPGDQGFEQCVVFTSWALTYIARDKRPDVVQAILRSESVLGVPVTLVTAEADGVVPGVSVVGTSDTVLAAQTREGARVLATVHPHGEWIRPMGEGATRRPTHSVD